MTKTHKFGQPSRMIIGTRGSICEGAEIYLSPILKKIRDNVKYNLKNTKELKEDFLKVKDKINLEEHTVMSLDVSKMFPSLPVKEISKLILDRVYSNPNFFFDAEELKDGHVSEFPDKSAFQNLVETVLFKLTSFSTLEGYYRQRDGSAMGSKLSPICADIFMHEIEAPFFDRLIGEGRALFIGRYVDDCLLVVKKSEIKYIFEEANKLHKNIKFTQEVMENNKLSFLDTQFRVHGQSIEMFHFEKESSRDFLPNFRTNVAPKAQKISLLVGHLHRVKNASSCEDAIEEGFRKTRRKFILNGYPPDLITQKIQLLEKPKPDKDIEGEITHNFRAMFTGARCDGIGRRMRAILKKVTPKFFLRLCWKTVRIEQCLHPTWKRPIPLEQKSGIVYHFRCPCGKSDYQGETKRQLGTRIQEHFEPRSRSPIFFHTLRCTKFQELFQKYLSAPDTPKYRPTTSRARIKTNFCFKNEYVSVISNQPYYKDRVLCEAFSIKLNDPALNKQIKFEEVKFL